MSELYKVILVDDEDDVRGRIVSKILPEMGFEVVGKAGNGYDALELIDIHKPHVVITDIKMPFINGIELARIIRRDYPTTKVAFISGYDEFEYAREAIELNVVSYLMKPITSSDIDNFLKKLKLSLDDEFDFLSNKDIIEANYKESIPILVNSYLNSFIPKIELTDKDISKLEKYNYELNKGNYVTVCVSMSGGLLFEETKVFLQTLVRRTFGNYDQCITFITPEGITFIVKDDRLKVSSDLDLQIYEVFKYVEKYRNIQIQFGVSKLYHDFKKFPKSYQDSDSALRHSKYFNMGDIIYFEDIEDIEKKQVVIEDSEFDDLAYELKFGSINEVKSKLKLIISKGMIEDEGVILDHQLMVVKLANTMINFIQSLQVNISTINNGNIIEELLLFNDGDSLFDYIINLVVKLREKNQKSQVKKTDKLMDLAIKYINEHYKDPSLSLEIVAEELSISVSYLSMLLSKLKGITFNKYLVKVRMEKAKELLKLTSEKIINIAGMCGYNEVYYFSHSFKKYSGMSPKEFRNNGK